MANNLAQRIQKQQEIGFLEIKNLSGLSLKIDPKYRPKNTFQQLDNFNLDTEGSITKINAPLLLSSNNAIQIVDAVEFSSNPNGSNLKVIGYSITDKKLYDVLGSAPSIVAYADISGLIGTNTAIPFMAQITGILIPYNIRSWIANTTYSYFDAVIKYSAADGNLYVFYVTTPGAGGGTGTSGTVEPIWPKSGTVTDGGSAPSFNVTLNGTTTDGTVTWTNRGNAAWAASHSYAGGGWIIDPNGNIEAVVAHGLSGSTSGTVQPLWGLTVGSQRLDTSAPNNFVLWQNCGQPSWIAGKTWPAGTTSVIIDPNGFIQEVTTPGTSQGGGATLVWTNAGLVTGDSFRTNYLVVNQQGNQPIKVTQYLYNNVPTIDASVVGVSAPEIPIDCESVTVTPNLNGLALQAGRAFCWTYYNPRTLHESSPAPFVGVTKIHKVDAGNEVVAVPGSLLPPLPATMPSTLLDTASVSESYQSYSLGIPVSALTPTLGTSFTHIRCYATKDGGASFFLLTNLLDVNGNTISNSDGSILIAQLTANQIATGTVGYVPLPTPQDAQAQVRVYDGGGPVNLVPDPQNLGPNNWSPGTTSGSANLTVVPGGSPDGQAAIEYIGTGSATTTVGYYRSTPIELISGQTYTFQAYMDDTNGNNPIKWTIISPDGLVTYATLTQSPGSSGVVTTTFTKTGPYRFVVIRVVLPVNTTVPIGDALVWGDPILEMGSSISNILPTYPQPDDALIIPAPGFGANDPPPVCAGIGAVFQNSLFFVYDTDRTKVVYSSDADFESFPSTQFQYLPSGVVVDPAMALETTYDRLIIGRQRSIFQGTGAAPEFAIQPVDARHGLMAYRGITATGSSLMAWLIDGLAQIGMGLNIPAPSQIGVGYSAEQLTGDPILPLLQTALRAFLAYNNQKPGIPQFAISDVTNDLFLIFKTV